MAERGGLKTMDTTEPANDSLGQDMNQEVGDEAVEKESPLHGDPKENRIIAKLNKCVVTVIPPGGVLASAFNLAATSLGAGILGLPAATNKSGLAMALLFLAIFTLLTIYSLRILGIAAQRTQVRSFEGVAGVLLGRWSVHFVAVVRGFHSLSGCVAYVISVGDIFSTIIRHTSSAPDFLRTATGTRLVTTLVWLFAMVPLVIPKHIDTLRYVSTFAVSFMVYFVIVLVVHSCMNGLPENIHNISVGNNNDDKLVLFNSGIQAIEGLGVFLFAYVCHMNAYEVYWDMADRSLSKFTLASMIDMVLCFLLYALTSFFGYLDFGREVTSSVLLMYDPIKDPEIMVAYVGVLVKLCCSFAMLSLATRNSLYSSIGWDVDKLPYWKHCTVVMILSTVMLLLGLFIPKITIVLGFAGSITGGFLGFIFPALFYMYSGNWTLKKVGIFNYVCTYVTLVSGVAAAVFGTAATIHGAIVGD